MSRKILLADDSLTIQKVVELTFAETDYEVIAVSSGDELLDRLPEVQPDIVICDVIMPGRDGYDVCQEIKSGSETLHLPVILLTGTFEPFDRDRALAAGCSEIITKPFEAKKLVETVEQLSTATGAPPPATPVDEGDSDDFDGRVTPPPPISVPDVADEPEDELEFDETDVRNEFASDESAAETTDEPVAADAEQSEPYSFAEETPAFESAAESIAIEFDSQVATGDDSFELPDVADPPDIDKHVEKPIGILDTVASDSAIEAPPDDSDAVSPDEQQADDDIEDPFSSEGDEQQPAESMDDPFVPEAEDEDPLQIDSPEFDEPENDEESDHTMTTPIDVAAVMGQADAEEESTFGDEDAPSIEADTSDADTQDVTERAEESVDSVEAETPEEQFEPGAPMETVAIRSPREPFADDAPAESFEAEAPEEPAAVEEPSDPFAADLPAEPFAAEAPEEPAAIEEPSDPFAAEAPEEPAAAEEPSDPFADDTPAESFAAEVPEEPTAAEEPSVSFADEMPEESFELETPEEAIAGKAPSDPFETVAPAAAFETEAPAAALETATPEEAVAVEPPVEPAAVEPPVEPAKVEAASLSDEDVDRIARRLLELASNRIEQIAWDVIPDVAEIVVRERVRELEADSEQ